jgi:hypothetical protein
MKSTLKTALLIGLLAFSGARSQARDFRPLPTQHELTHQKGANKAVIGIVEKMTGSSEVQRSGTSGVSLGERIFEKDRLITKRSRLHTRFKDGTYVEMGEESSFEVERVRFKSPNVLPADKGADQFDESVFRFLYGIARVTAANVHPLQYFTVKTVNAILRVTGPADFYLIQLVNERDLTVRVAKGKVRLMNIVTNEQMDVPEGSAAYIKVSGAVTGGGSFTEDQLEFLKSRTRS